MLERGPEEAATVVVVPTPIVCLCVPAVALLTVPAATLPDPSIHSGSLRTPIDSALEHRRLASRHGEARGLNQSDPWKQSEQEG